MAFRGPQSIPPYRGTKCQGPEEAGFKAGIANPAMLRYPDGDGYHDLENEVTSAPARG